MLRFASDVYTDTILRFARTINGQAPTLWASTSPDPSKRAPASFGDVNTTPHKLEWDMTPELKIAVRFAETRLADLIEQNEFHCLDFQAYGKNLITSMGFSPDAFVQMAFQAAYYGLYGRVECTYEPAMTKMFLHGRTEAVRTVSAESVHFVQTFWADNPAEQKVEALKRACQTHVDNTRACAKGEGCDRHLYALFCLWQRLVDDRSGVSSSTSTDGANSSSSTSSGYTSNSEDTAGGGGGGGVGSHEPHGQHNMVTRARGDSTTSRTTATLPLIFADGGWDKLNNTILSTSNCGNPSLRHFGFGPVSGDGFGIGYIIKNESIAICASSKHRQTRRFVDTLESYLLEIRRVLRITSRAAATAAANSGGGAVPGLEGKQTRAREIDRSGRKMGKASQAKPRGRLLSVPAVLGPPTGAGEALRRERLASVATGAGAAGTSSPFEESVALSEDDELGGCKCFFVLFGR